MKYEPSLALTGQRSDEDILSALSGDTNMGMLY